MQEITPRELFSDHQLIINEDTIFSRGYFLLKGRKQSPAILVQGENFTIDLNYSILDGRNYSGVGIYLRECQNITVKNGIIKGFFYGLSATGCQNIQILGNNFSNNFDNPNAGWLDDNFKGDSHGFGGGILLKRTLKSLVQNNTMCHEFNGIDLLFCDDITITENNCSLNSNWGLHLLSTRHCLIVSNRMDHCIRYLNNGHDQNGGCDSAGILLEERSSYNRFIKNSFIHGGDGLFLRANNLHRNCHNYFAHNNGSYSPHNAFEDGFGIGNIYEGNIASDSDYGFWLPEAYSAVLRDNIIERNKKNGIVIGHDQNNTLVDNTICKNGIDSY